MASEMTTQKETDPDVEFARLADSAARALLRMESLAARGVVSVPPDSVPYVLRDLKRAREDVRLIQNEVADAL